MLQPMTLDRKPHKQSDTPSDTAANRLLGSNQCAVLQEDNGGGDFIVKKERVPPLFINFDFKDLAKLEAELPK